MHGALCRANGRRAMNRCVSWGLVAFALISCGPGTPTRPDKPTPPVPARVVEPVQSAVPIASVAEPPPALVSATPSASSSASAPPPAPTTTAGPAFPPASFVPPHQRSAKPGDGVFTLLEEGAAAGTNAVARTTVHPHPYKKDPFVIVLAVDLRRVDLVLRAGTEEPVSKTVPPERRPGLVAKEDLSSLIAVFNGGFQTKHGQWGARIDGDDFVTPREDACSVAFLDDGSLRIATHRTLAPEASRLRSYRQTPPCLIEGGVPDARLVHEDTARLWGAAIGSKREIRRTALGLDKSRQTLFFGIGEWIWARDLALAMHVAGAVDVAELDINWSYTRFLLYDRASPPNVVSTLIDKVEYTKDGYVSKPAPRDFFYLRRKSRP